MGPRHKKIGCASHVTKCYRSSLPKLVSERTHYKGKGGLIGAMRKCLASAARCAIKMSSLEKDRGRAIRQLEEDLMNGSMHCFGNYNQCSPDFCHSVQAK